MRERLVVIVGGERVAFAVDEVRQVVTDVRIHPLPGHFGAVAGFVSLRGRVATAVDLGRCLGHGSAPAGKARCAVVVRRAGEDYALLVDDVEDLREPVAEPLGADAAAALVPRWRELVRAVHRLDDGLVAEVDLDRLLDAACRGEAVEERA